jgi:DNA integrity scanning protein DisA with diadenylate cyclase activity
VGSLIERLAFLAPGWRDVVEILLVAVVIYRILLVFAGTRAFQMLLGFFLLVGVYVVSRILGLTLVEYLLTQLFNFGVIAALIVFQPELRSGLASLGQNRLFRAFTGMQGREVNEEIVEAVEDLSRDKVGAIIAIEEEFGLGEYLETGTPLQARVSAPLLQNIFTPYSLLHDGAAVVRGAPPRRARPFGRDRRAGDRGQRRNGDRLGGPPRPAAARRHPRAPAADPHRRRPPRRGRRRACRSRANTGSSSTDVTRPDGRDKTKRTAVVADLLLGPSLQGVRPVSFCGGRSHPGIPPAPLDETRVASTEKFLGLLQHFLTGYELNLPGVDVLETAPNLFRPRSFHDGIDTQAREKCFGDVFTSGAWQRERLSCNLFCGKRLHRDPPESGIFIHLPSHADVGKVEQYHARLRGKQRPPGARRWGSLQDGR